MNPYKCTTHKLDLFCPGCIKAYINRYDKMLEFIRYMIKEWELEPFTAIQLLKELELPEEKDSIGKWPSDTLSMENGGVGELTEKEDSE